MRIEKSDVRPRKVPGDSRYGLWDSHGQRWAALRFKEGVFVVAEGDGDDGDARRMWPDKASAKEAIGRA